MKGKASPSHGSCRLMLKAEQCGQGCFHLHPCPHLLLFQPLALLLTPPWLEEREETTEDKSSAIWSLPNGDTLSVSFSHGDPLMTLQIASPGNLPLHVQLLTAVCPPDGPFNSSSWQSWDSWYTSSQSPSSRLWLAPSCVTYTWYVGRTHLGPTVSESYGCFNSASSVFILWHMAISFIFSPGASGSKVSLQRTLVMSPRNLLPCSTHVLRQHQDPRGHLIGVR